LDFGLARQISRDHDTPSSKRRKKLSGGCGTPRYTAPEVMLHLDYSFPADVHSFCILLWEIATLQRPYSDCKTLQELLETTVQKRQRPPLTGVVASGDVKQVLKSGWSHNPNSRPTFHSIVKQLEFHVDTLSFSEGVSRK
jgi:serine/threonine protein kinase